MSKNFERREKEDQPVLAICYDFDKTLSPDDMQAQGYIQSVDYDIKDFWVESNKLAEDNDMDQNLAYMFKMMEESEGHFVFNKEKLAEYGSKVTLFPGVDSWFERTRNYGKEKGVIVEHYIISSGLKEMIEGTQIAKEGAFEKIYASSFYYNERGVAKWPAQVVNYTNKTQFLFRIEKGALDVNDPAVNDYYSPDELRVPFRNMVYIGDSDTDIPCMKLVNLLGGHSIGVYNPDTQDKSKVYKMIKDQRIKYFFAADYTEGKELDSLIKMIIDKTAANEKLESIHYENLNESIENENKDKRNEDEREIDALIVKLVNSGSFLNTHTIIAELNRYSRFSRSQIERICDAAIDNQQIYWIINDNDIRRFYLKIIEAFSKSKKRMNESIKAIKDRLENEDD